MIVLAEPTSRPAAVVVALPIVALVSPSAAETVIAAPAATAPPATPNVLVSSVRVVLALTRTSLPAPSVAPSPTCAVCVAVEFRTATCPPTATTPPVTAKATPVLRSVWVAAMTTSPAVVVTVGAGADRRG